MDVAAVSMSMSQNKAVQQASFSMMKKAMDQTKVEGQQMAEMIQNTGVVSATKVNVLV